MLRSLQWWKLIATLVASLSVGTTSMNSINMVFEDFENIDLSFLGTPNLTEYDARVDFSVERRPIDEKPQNDECIYNIHINFDPSRKETPAGKAGFEGGCKANGGNATDGLPWHAHRRHWMRLPEHVYEATGLNHFEMEWVPCGRSPVGFRKARWDLNFFTVIPEYRRFMICDTFNTPSTICQWNQTTHLGRRMFTLPRLAQDPYYLANLPLDFMPDQEFPEAYEYEGLIHYDPLIVPNATENWTLPNFMMSTYDSATVSWRAMIPFDFYDGKYWCNSSQYQYYVYQTMMGLPSNWSTYYDQPSSRMDVNVLGHVLPEHKDRYCGLQATGMRNNDKIFFEGKKKPVAMQPDSDLH